MANTTFQAPDATTNDLPTDGHHNNEKSLNVINSMQGLESSRSLSEEKDLGKPQPQRPNGKPPINPRLLQNPVPLDQLNETAMCIDCPHYHQRTVTRTHRKSSGETGTTALLCCLFLGVIGACIPYCCEMYYDTDHFCQICDRQVVHKPHDGPVQLCLPLPPGPTPPPKAVVQGKNLAV